MTPAGTGIYACPHCKRHLLGDAGALRCPACSRVYPVDRDMPDFLGETLSLSSDPVLRRMTGIDRIARIYETRLWYPVVLTIFGGVRSPSLARLIGTMSANVRTAEGRVLDVACGPGTFGRRIASPSKEVFGIDVSWGMLRQGAAYAAKEGIRNLHFARARVEALPFEDRAFDAALCCGSLHLFADTVAALREIARTMKPGAMLSVFTFAAGRGGILRFRRVREWSRKHQGLHVFELPQLERFLNASGFTDFRPRLSGSILTFSARRTA